jgi:hypothetical protein
VLRHVFAEDDQRLDASGANAVGDLQQIDARFGE